MTIPSVAAVPLYLSVAAALLAPTVQITTGPPDATHLIYDASRREMLMLASSRESGQDEVWRREQRQWTKLSAPGPPARHLGGAAFDSRRQRLVIQGGLRSAPGEAKLGDTWEWDGAIWRSIPATAIGTRDHHAMAYDEARGRIVLFGGNASGNDLATDTWEYDGASWTRVATSGPPGRAHFGMVYDARMRRVVIFGGLAQSADRRFGSANDTWAWDGTAWAKLSDTGPSPRTHIRIAFDRGTNNVVLFGGQANGRPTVSLADTWTFDGQQWTEVKTPGPSARSWHLMAFNQARGRTMLYGGSVYDGKVSTMFYDTWEFDGRSWTP